MTSRDEFYHYVKEALSNLYDPVCLQTHPLVGLLEILPEPGATSGETLRKVLRETIELLRPDESIPIGRAEWDGYRVLWLHYVRSLSPSDTCMELNISESSFFRRQREALDALVSILWERCRETSPPEDGNTGATLPSRELALQRSIALARESPEEVVDLRELLSGILSTIQPLSEQREVALEADVSASLPPVRGDPAVLRQVFLNLIVEGIRLASGKTLELGVSAKGNQIVWRLSGLADLNPERELESRGGFVITRSLVRHCQGQMWIERNEEGAPVLLLSLPIVESRCILVVDDDPMALDLYRRCLRSREFVLIGARNAQEARALLAERKPDLVLLDVLMPLQDGWTILRYLKETPRTANIPVVVCSVISQTELAMALGAADVLNKPFTPEELVHTIEVCLGRANSEEQAC